MLLGLKNERGEQSRRENVLVKLDFTDIICQHHWTVFAVISPHTMEAFRNNLFMFVSCNTNDEGNGSDKNDFGDTWSYVFLSWICQNMCSCSKIISSIPSWLEKLLIRATKQHRSKFKNTSIFTELIESDNFSFTPKQHNHINNNLSRLRTIKER